MMNWNLGKDNLFIGSMFYNTFLLRFNFLLSLQMVVDDSTICLMNHERKQVLDLIMDLAKQVRVEYICCDMI